MAKSAEAFRTISEAADAVGVAQHVLRFWETKFAFVTPVKRAGGRRFYRPQDIQVLKAVKRLLHEDGLTIRGVQRLHKEQGLRKLVGAEVAALIDEAAARDLPEQGKHAGTPPGSSRLHAALAELEQAKSRLDAVLFR